MGSLSLITTTATRRRLIFVPAVTRQQKQHGQGPERGRFLRGAAPDVQGLLQVDGHQQGWHPGQDDLRGAFDNVGVLMSESELDSLLGEVGGACTYDNMVKMFQEKMAGDGNDP